MSNMSYCRFHNTLSDFMDCRHIVDSLDEGEEPPLSRDEATAAANLMMAAVDLAVRLAEFAEKDVEDLQDEDAIQFVEYINDIATQSKAGEI